MNTSPAPSSLIALIPAYNEAAHVGDVVRRARQHLPVLVVDDGSSDDTIAVARAAGARVWEQPANQGKGMALRAGFRWALEHNMTVVITLDADGQHDPDEIPCFVHAYARNHADLIIGARDFSRIPPVRRLANTLGQKSFSWALGHDIPDNQSGYRLLSRRMMTTALESTEQGFEFEVEMIVQCVLRGYQLDWVPIRTIYADERSHIHPFWHTVHFTRMVWRARRLRRQYRKPASNSQIRGSREKG